MLEYNGICWKYFSNKYYYSQTFSKLHVSQFKYASLTLRMCFIGCKYTVKLLRNVKISITEWLTRLPLETESCPVMSSNVGQIICEEALCSVCYQKVDEFPHWFRLPHPNYWPLSEPPTRYSFGITTL